VEVVALGGHLLEDRVDDAAGPAPGRPEIDQHGPVRVEDLGLEGGVGYVGKVSGHFSSYVGKGTMPTLYIMK